MAQVWREQSLLVGGPTFLNVFWRPGVAGYSAQLLQLTASHPIRGVRVVTSGILMAHHLFLIYSLLCLLRIFPILTAICMTERVVYNLEPLTSGKLAAVSIFFVH